MIGNYGGYWAMAENRLLAFERMSRASFLKGNTPDFLLQAELFRQERHAKLRSKSFGQYMLESGQYLNTPFSPVIEITGPLSRHGECNYGYEDVASFIYAASDNPDVKTIGLKVDSPGGNVDGANSIPEAIIYAKKKNKKTMAWGGYIASAAFLSVSNCDEIYLDKQASSEIGSAGVLFVHVDETEALEKAGIKVTIHRAPGSENKARLNSIEPVNEEVLSKELKVLGDLRKELIGYIRRGRIGKLKSSEWEDASMFHYSKAKSIGLVDGQMGLNEFLNYINKN